MTLENLTIVCSAHQDSENGMGGLSLYTHGQHLYQLNMLLQSSAHMCKYHCLFDTYFIHISVLTVNSIKPRYLGTPSTHKITTLGLWGQLILENISPE